MTQPHDPHTQPTHPELLAQYVTTHLDKLLEQLEQMHAFLSMIAPPDDLLTQRTFPTNVLKEFNDEIYKHIATTATIASCLYSISDFLGSLDFPLKTKDKRQDKRDNMP